MLLTNLLTNSSPYIRHFTKILIKENFRILNIYGQYDHYIKIEFKKVNLYLYYAENWLIHTYYTLEDQKLESNCNMRYGIELKEDVNQNIIRAILILKILTQNEL